MTKKQKKRFSKLLRKEIERNNKYFYKDLSKVFQSFGKETEQKLSKKLIDEIDWKSLNTKILSVFGRNNKRACSNFVKFLSKTFSLKINRIEGVINETVKEHAKKSSQKIVGVIDKTKQQIANVIEEAQTKGLPQNEIAKLISDKFTEISVGRAKTIARTETSSIFSKANKNTADEANMNKKTWIHTGAGATDRLEHLALDGKTIGIDEYFNLGGEKALHPHDNSLSAEQVINCNCIVIYE